MKGTEITRPAAQGLSTVQILDTNHKNELLWKMVSYRPPIK